MQKGMIAVVLAAMLFVQPAYSQQAAPRGETVVATAAAPPAGPVVAEEKPAAEKNKNPVSPGSFIAGTAVVGVVVLVTILLAGLAFMPSP